jgi:2-oxoglutarate ferredoxin oxidoreductase subunit beta
MSPTYQRPQALKPVVTHYCGGCGHGVAHKLLAELIDEMGIRERTIALAPVGCAVLLYCYLDVDCSEAAHGRTPAVATGLKRARPDCVVISYQGDGDLAAIGTAEIIHAANRGENFTTIFVNNAVYGMTGGQMAPTTLEGQRTATTPSGRRSATEGPPLRVCELLSNFARVSYLARTTVTSPRAVRATRQAIRRGIEAQMEGRGFSLIEVLAPCPTYWRLSPAESFTFIDETMTKTFPLGVFRDYAGG